MILDNPFHLLGLSADATVRDIRRRSEELKLAIDLGRETILTEFDLTRARQELEDPLKRFGHELTWIHVSPDIVDPRFEFQSGPAGLPLPALKNVAGSTSGLEKAKGIHGLAVVQLGAFIARPDDVDLDSALDRWSEVCESTLFWEYIGSRARDADDPRLTPEFVTSARKGLPSRILEPVSAIGATALERGGAERAKAIIRAIRTSGLPPEDIRIACKRVSERQRIAIESGIKKADDAIRRIPTAEGGDPSIRGKLDEAESILIADVLRPHAEFRALDPTDKDVELSDEVALITRWLGTRATFDPGGWLRAYLLMDQAMGLAASSDAITKYAVDRAEVRASLHDSEADAAIENRAWLRGSAHLELASEYASDDEYASDLRARASGARSVGLHSEAAVESEKSALESDLSDAVAHFQARIAGTATGEFIPRAIPTQPTNTPKTSPPIQSVHTPTDESNGGGGGRALIGLIGVGILAVLIASVFAISSSSGGASSTSVDSAPLNDAPPIEEGPTCADKQHAAEVRVDKATARQERESDRLDIEERRANEGKKEIDREFPSQTLSPSEYQRYLPYRDRQSARINKFNRHLREYKRHTKQLHRYERRFTKLSQSDDC